MDRLFELLLLTSEANIQARQIYKETFGKLKVDGDVVVGSIYVSDVEHDQQGSGDKQVIQNPLNS